MFLSATNCSMEGWRDINQLPRGGGGAICDFGWVIFLFEICPWFWLYHNILVVEEGEEKWMMEGHEKKVGFVIGHEVTVHEIWPAYEAERAWSSDQIDSNFFSSNLLPSSFLPPISSPLIFSGSFFSSVFRALEGFSFSSARVFPVLTQKKRGRRRRRGKKWPKKVDCLPVRGTNWRNGTSNGAVVNSLTQKGFFYKKMLPRSSHF